MKQPPALSGPPKTTRPTSREPPSPARRSRATGSVRIEDVGREAGLSAQTVSRFLHFPDQVSTPNQERIRSAIAAVGYRPNLLAMALASNRSRVVAILVPTIANPVHAAPVQGLSDAVREAGYQVLVGTTGYDAAAEQALVGAFLGRRVDGMILTGAAQSHATRAMLKGAALPVVQLWEVPADRIDSAVGVRNAAIGEAVARHFAARGYRRLAVVRHAAAGDTRSAARELGFLESAAELGLPPPLRLSVDRPAEMAQAPELVAELLLHGVEAVFCVGDQLAIGVVLACQRRGVAIPAQLAVAGVGDSDLAALITPALTTVRIPRYELGLEAGRHLLARFADRHLGPVAMEIDFELLIRETS